MTILGRSEELVSRCIECDLAEPESLASLGGSAPGVVDGILSKINQTGRELLSCAYTTQLLHSTVEVCWNNSDSSFIW